MKKALWIGLGLLVASRSFAGVFISEYIEGSGVNKALEIYNGTAATIDLANYRFGKGQDGTAPTEANIHTITGTVAPGQVFVITRSDANAALVAQSDAINPTLCNWNGDDCVYLYEMIGGVRTLIDVVGLGNGTDPGNGWPVAGVSNATQNHTLFRKSSILQGNTDWTVSAGTDVASSEWTVSAGNDDFSGIGNHTVEGGDTAPAIADLAHLPLVPLSSESVTVSANVTDDNSLTAVNLVYTVDGGAAQTVAMTLGVAPAYSGVIPAQAMGAVVAYHVEATDNAAHTTLSANGGYTVFEPSTLNPGDLVITEIMNNPNAVGDTQGEWFEVYNNTGATIDLAGLTVLDASGANFTIASSVLVPAGDYAVLGNNADNATNGGLTVDYAYSNTFALNNSGTESLIIRDNSTDIDRVDFAYGATPAWPLTAGASFYLLNIASDNNVATSWTLSTIPYGAGDFGTPGGVTPSDVPPAVSGLAFLPLMPTSTTPVTVTANVTDDFGLTAVNLVYTVNGGAAQSVAMTLVAAPQYSGVIPAQADGAVVAFHVDATDTGAQTTSSASSGYTVSDSFPCADIATIRANDETGTPLLLNQVRSVCGVVTMSNQLGAAGPIYITGSTGSVALYGAGFVTGVTIGDEIQATGTVGFYNGLTEFVTPTYLNIVGHPGEPTPVALTLDALAAGGETYEAQLVHVTGLELAAGSVWPASNANGTVNVTNGTTTFQLFIDRDTDIDGSAAPAGTFDLTAVIGQFDNATPYFESYQLIPRSLADFTFTGNQPASIGTVARTPYVPTSTEAVTVSATIVDDTAVTGANLHYQVNGGGYTSVPMTAAGDVYSALIPAQADLAVVDYYLTATDATETTTSATASYTVYNTFPCVDLANLHVLDENGVTTMVNQRVYVCGTVTATNQFAAAAGPVYISTATGAVAVYGANALPAGLQIGDSYQAVGTVKNYNGLVEIDPTEYAEITGHPGAVTPQSVTLAQLIANPEAYEAELVEVGGLTLDPGAVWPASGSNATLTVWQGSDSFALQIDKDTDLDEGTAPVGEFTLRALVGQYDTTSPYTSGYQLLPRFQADILTGVDAPVVTISYSAGNVQLSWPAVAGASDYKVLTSTDGYSGWDAGTLTGGATTFTAPAGAGRAFYQVIAVN